jgi:hypothetical protein
MATFCCSRRLCKRCHKNRMFLSVRFASMLTNVRRQTIYRWMLQGSVHWIGLNGHRLVCLQSLTSTNQMQ